MQKKGINAEHLISELEATVQLNDPDSKFIDELELDELCDYIERRHHTYVSDIIPFIQQKLQKLCGVHGENHSELYEIKTLFDGAAENLSAHMKKEELILFPQIRKMVLFKKKGGNANEQFVNVKETIDTMHQEHYIEGERFEKISKLTSAYNCPPDGCSTYQMTYETLKEFENDLHRHIHLENNVLFKKVLFLESEFLK